MIYIITLLIEFEVFNMVFDKNTLVIPDETIYEENKLLVNGDISTQYRSLRSFNISYWTQYRIRNLLKRKVYMLI